MVRKNGSNPKSVESVKHKDKRVNIPTEELRDFVSEEETKPKTILYPRDTSLDPQLVWKGKDEQDQKDLAVPAVPIYIQEKIQPQVIIENVRTEARKGKVEQQASLFADFNGIEFKDQVDFYRHEQNWSNRIILGDSLLVMTSLAEKEGLKGKAQMIYVDPPYGIEFDSNWQVSTRKKGAKNGKIEDLTRQPEQIKAFRDTWKLGIHSYLSYLRDRLSVARELLTETGSIFVQIGDENVHLVRSVMDEVYGSENFIALIRFRKKTMPLGATFLERMGDFIIWYAKQKTNAEIRYHQLYRKQDYSDDFHWDNYELPDGKKIKVTEKMKSEGYIIPEGSKKFRLVSLWPASFDHNAVFPVPFRGKDWWPAEGQCWPTSPEGMRKLIFSNQIEPEGSLLRKVLYYEGAEYSKITADWSDTIGAREKGYVVETHPLVVERCILMTTNPGDLVIDPTCGGGTTAYVSEKWGRRWITIDTSRVALSLTRTRLMKETYPYFILADSLEGLKKQSELEGGMPPSYKTDNDIRKGFVNKRVTHITLRSITSNPYIKEGMSREEIDSAIRQNAETLTLYDQPYKDSKKIRVTGRLTVENLSPHRVLSTDTDIPESEQEARKAAGIGGFEQMILDYLKRSGIQNRIKNERLTLDRLEPYAGEWIHAKGEYSDSNGTLRRVAVCIGPEHGTVGPQLIKEAAKEAVQGIGFDILVVCGFAFDPHVSEEAKRYGNLTVLSTRMNNDLMMSDELLKKTGAGNLFMVFGEPDIDMQKQNDGRLIVEIKGIDVYDPTTGQIRSNSTDDIACWFIDTNYNGESFFVRHAYFTGGDEPYKRLKRTLRTEIDESAWESLYSTASYPFDPPETGRIAVKVINHYGDEILKTYDLRE